MRRFVVGAAGDEPDVDRVPAPPVAERLDKLLVRLMPEHSRSTLQRWIADGRVRVDGATGRAKDKVVAGTVIEVEPAAPPASAAEPDAGVAFQVLHEDADIIVVNKPAGLVVHPGRGHPTGTLVNGLLARAGFDPPVDDRDPEGLLRPGIVHRLDKDTSGVLVVAKTVTARERLKDRLASHDLDREYLALTRGVPEVGDIDTLHGRHPVARLRFTSKCADGKRAHTRIIASDRLAGGRAGLVRCRLETGRTHQIRVHLAEQRRTPVLGDQLYGGMSRDPQLRPVVDAMGRHALHAAHLGFAHPIDGRPMAFTVPLPDELQRAHDVLAGLDEPRF